MHLSTLVEIAAGLRRGAGLSRPPFSTKAIIAACFPLTVVAGAVLPEGIEEVVSRRGEGHLIVYSRALAAPHQRFAIAHAVAHIAFDDLSKPRARARVGYLGDQWIEARADVFAAELLCPQTVLRGDIEYRPSRDLDENDVYLDHVDELASRFNVPADVIDVQIRRVISVDMFG